MSAVRGATYSFALDHALDLAQQLGVPLLVLEPLRVAYPWASDRLHTFLLQCMADNQAAFACSPVHYYAYVEAARGAGAGLLAALAEGACVADLPIWAPDFERHEGSPAWAKQTLAEHSEDAVEAAYTLEQPAEGQTHDPVWNAAQRLLRASGVMHDYLRTPWGKRVLALSATPEQAFDTLVARNNRHPLDGRDPSSYADISWIFGHAHGTMSGQSTGRSVT